MWAAQGECAHNANFMLAPSWESMLKQGTLATSEGLLLAGMRRWVAAVQPVLDRLAALHEALDLEDRRRSNG